MANRNPRARGRRKLPEQIELPEPSQEQLVMLEENIRCGVTPRRALLIAGYDDDAREKLYELADAGIEPYKTLVRSVKQSEAEFEADMVRKMAKSKDWRGAKELLSRRLSDEWGDKVQVEVKTQVEEIFRVAKEVLPEEWFERLIDACAAGRDGAAGAAPVEPRAVH